MRMFCITFSLLFSNQAPQFQASLPITLTNDTFISQKMLLTPANNNEINNALKSLSNSNAIGTDGLLFEIIKITQILFRDS